MSTDDSTAALILERGKTHGNFTDHALVTQDLKSIIRTEESNRQLRNQPGLSACQRESLEMIAHKIGRILAGDPSVKDHWDDIAGYAKLVADRCTN